MNTSAWLKAAFSYIHTNTLNENDLRSDCFSSFYKSLQTSGSQTFVACPTSEAKKKTKHPNPQQIKGGEKVGFYLYKVHIISATASNVFLHPTKGKKNQFH